MVNPYFIEMTGVGYSTYLIGYGESADRNGITTFKLNRISKVNILDEDFDIPDDFNIEKLLELQLGCNVGRRDHGKAKVLNKCDTASKGDHLASVSAVTRSA